jgi:hypothetical protein
MKSKVCVECGDSFEGRVDKIYCSPYCKSSFHYNKHKDEGETLFRKIDTQLKLNRRLLKHFNQAGKSTLRAEKLIAAGFDPTYFTHYWKNSQDKVYLFCYDVGFLKIKEGSKTKYLLIDWQDYMKRS